ncbi:amylo-alpha-1,6-glucosidase [Pseudonocardia sp. KRD-184]|uniref:Amylo-alpha-1,6-glucosidase n=1 Tax=Pseudonocardia oceani TaxID=2792013 RepID=A0ABS6UCF8_9PSEU|nr:glycogen debranching N-terminal domain-containing protein [Pseudonocardia oceani]MBW0090855.1 amylo-alpha-1,6-glucosidase [Pseudonocardia oceani]MBW0098438.1 amylo-alpha-1,6-glucosidase [Pseudonocardia oceani]MBW0110994.1 amylo-alpha-1,6-glucosidase [Pseudonocardia oceani]MBW0121761.1 amylo-alpha-1,6-glucosidase [Pseudonocardia oceani]MBW0129921.1 amylo-alpha-1,6-glucosidase [Pseudonocardia oceani]
MGAWTPEAQPAGTGAVVTLVEGASFCLCTPGGDLTGAGPHGVFFRDTRILSRFDLRVDGEFPEPLAAMTPEPYRGTFLGRSTRRTGRTDSNLLVQRDRRVGNGLREDIVIGNPAGEPAACTVTVAVDADFADLFEVKEGRVQARGERSAQGQGERLVLDQRWRDTHRGAVVLAPGGSVDAVPGLAHSAGSIRYEVVVPARGRWTASLLVQPVVDGDAVEPSFPLDRPVRESLPARRLQRWQETTPIATTGHDGLQRVLRRSQEDLGALRIFDPVDPSLAAVAAGAPWFMALFGRDSLLTAYMALPVDRSLALGTLRTLARHQGRRTDPLTEEEPGRILHEVRLGVESGLSLGGGSTYYGTVDATPLFVVLLGELARWGADPRQVAELLPHADRALEWIRTHGDRNGDGFVEYRRATDRGLVNQGWKDSWDGITSADGRPAEAPIALCEVQGYVYDAYRTRAELARTVGDEEVARGWDDRAAALKEAFNERFWLPDRGWFALALDRDGRPVDACASNMGHCLWSGVVDEDKARAVADHLLSPAMFSGWGVRTLSRDMGAYDPVSYHNGSVWPHDNALVVAGLLRYGFVHEAQRVAEALLEAAQHFGGRLPELFCGFDRDEYPEPVPYPTSCSPQAWAAAAPIQLVRTLLRFDPRLPRGELWVDPVLPSAFTPLRVEGVALGGTRIDLAVSADGTVVERVPDGVEVRHEWLRGPGGAERA